MRARVWVRSARDAVRPPASTIVMDALVRSARRSATIAAVIPAPMMQTSVSMTRVIGRLRLGDRRHRGFGRCSLQPPALLLRDGAAVAHVGGDRRGEEVRHERDGDVICVCRRSQARPGLPDGARQQLPTAGHVEVGQGGAVAGAALLFEALELRSPTRPGIRA